ncbi:hypothetical protein [Nocardia thailandica]|uniref:hypothetical protein n=1 Tax=Nocardia thailandica TaxID=257275 RepID=UPI0002D7C93F|nr:hypothetical protein [Nocardia thailandica]
MSFSKSLGACAAAVAFGALLGAGPAAAAAVEPAPVVAPGEPAPGGTSTGSAVTDAFAALVRTMQCGSAAQCPY